ncbi:LOW QUALITY PROTEIN: putative lipid scramblase CLPTM1 [Cyanocitta cristata]
MAAPGTEAAAGPGPGPGQVTSNGSAGGRRGGGGGGGGAGGSSSSSSSQQPGQQQQQQQQQQPGPNAWQVIKGVLLRIFIIWAISSWFRRAPAPQEPNSPGGSPRSPSRNLFPKDTLMDLYVYVSEHEHFTDFNVSCLFWEKRDLVYGDWSSGENSDGCYEHFGELDVSQVGKREGKWGFGSQSHSQCSQSLPGLVSLPNSQDFPIFSHFFPFFPIFPVFSPFQVALLETNPYLLALTIVVSIVHSVFEFLAFKNDIQFWNSRQSLEGLSVRSVFFGVFQSLVVLLYILDNETNVVVQLSVFIGLLIDLWKIKVMDVRLDRENKVAGMFPRVSFTDKSTYVESSTKVYDDMAFRYLSWILFPLLGCYAVYSLLYLEHKGWYSWVLSMLYGFLLTFGFITMTPQLFINYKLQSVAHLPWRMLTYKALNTFIDDLFAFVIKMPMMYRIGCLRDDVVFFVYLYQRWIYRVDPTRVNEFGGTGQAPAAPKPPPDARPDPTALPTGPPAPQEKPPEDKKKD